MDYTVYNHWYIVKKFYLWFIQTTGRLFISNAARLSGVVQLYTSSYMTSVAAYHLYLMIGDILSLSLWPTSCKCAY